MRSSSVNISLLRIAAYVRDGGRGTELRSVQYCCFFDLARFPMAAQMIISVIRRRILLPSMGKAMLMSIKTVEIELSDPDKANAAMYSQRYFFPMNTCANVSCNSPGVTLLVIMAI